MYDRGTLFAKACFIVMMVVATGMFFRIRLHVVYEYGWAAGVHSSFEFDRRGHEGVDWRQVFIASITPPLVDLLQSTLLIASSSYGGESQHRNLPPSEHTDERFSRIEPGTDRGMSAGRALDG